MPAGTKLSKKNVHDFKHYLHQLRKMLLNMIMKFVFVVYFRHKRTRPNPCQILAASKRVTGNDD
jgi:hypothetical protein